MKDKRILITIAAIITVVLIISILAISCNCGETVSDKTIDNTSNQTSEPAGDDTTTYIDETTTDEQNTSNIANLGESSSDEGILSSDVSSNNSEAETTTESITTTKAPETTTIKKTTTKETTTKAPETTTKVQETTTQKPNLPKVDTSLAILKEYADSYNVAPNVDDWRIYYTEDDCVGDGLDAYRVGLLKYSSDGTQLYVLTTDSEGKMGYLGTNDEAFFMYDSGISQKWEAFHEAFQEKYQAYTIGWGHDSIIIGSSLNGAWALNPESGNIGDPYHYAMFHFSNVDAYINSKGELVSVYNWEHIDKIDCYLLCHNNYTSILNSWVGNDEIMIAEFGKTEISIEDIVIWSGVTIDSYYKGEKIAKQYDIVAYSE